MKRDKGIGKVLLSPLAALYFVTVKTRNFFYDNGLCHSYSPKTPTVCIGNITVGGTGKTPHIEMLIDLLSKKYRIATLSRGYKRKSRGYKEVETDDTALDTGDEPLQIKQKFPNTVVSVNADRVEGINQITFSHPDTEIILLDDAFQHRKVKAGFNILLIDYNRPIWTDLMLPIGNLRDTNDQIKRANAVIITKCPVTITPLEKRLLSKKISLYPYQSLFFSTVAYGDPTPLFPDTQPFVTSKHNLLISGIAEPAPLISYLASTFGEVTTLRYADHHNFTDKDLNDIAKKWEEMGKSTNIFTTEKDAKRLISLDLPEELKNCIYFVPIKAKLTDNSEVQLIQKIEKYVKEDTGYRRIHKK